MKEEDSQASPLWIWFAIVLFGFMGLIMLAQGLGLHDASWLNPNPDVPRWVFTLIGLLLLLAIPLLLNQLRPLANRLVNFAGYSFLAGAWALSHWMIFIAEGGSCSFQGITLALGLPDILCKGLFGALLLLFDVVAAFIAARSIKRKFSSAARS